MLQGAEIDILTLRPRQETRPEEGLSKAEKERLLENVEALELVTSPEGNFFIEMLTNKLENRIAKLVIDDVEASVYVRLLQDIGNKVFLAKIAAKKLADKYTRSDIQRE